MLFRLLVVLFKCTYTESMYGSWWQTKKHHKFAVSLPQGIIAGHVLTPNQYKHEYGHYRQYEIYGKRWWIKVALPSLLGNIKQRIFHLTPEWYYNQKWEKEADDLGGAER